MDNGDIDVNLVIQEPMVSLTISFDVSEEEGRGSECLSRAMTVSISTSIAVG
jgi:hypothetical protein